MDQEQHEKNSKWRDRLNEVQFQREEAISGVKTIREYIREIRKHQLKSLKFEKEIYERIPPNAKIGDLHDDKVEEKKRVRSASLLALTVFYKEAIELLEADLEKVYERIKE